MKMARLVLLTLMIVVAGGALGSRGWAAAPTLSQVGGEDRDLPKVVRAGQKYVLQLKFTDADGDRPKRATFFDKAPSATVTTPGTIGTGNPKDGIVITWDINGFEQGGHQTYFEVQGSDGNIARYPAEQTVFYEFVAEALATKIGIMAAGAAVGLVFLPFIVYVLARSLNRRGDPSRAARVGLLIGILACAALFIVLFASFYGVLAWAIGIVAGLALLVLVLTRR